MKQAGRFLPILLLLFMAGNSLVAQPARTKVSVLRDTLNVYSLDIIKFRQYGLLNFQPMDTGLLDIHRLDPALARHGANESIGNLGTATQPLQFRPDGNFLPGEVNLPRTGFRHFDTYTFLPGTLPHLYSHRPFTNITYQLGSASEHYFHVFHTQEVSDNFQISGQYRHLNSAGTYRRQDAVHHNAALGFRVRSNNQRYVLLGQLIHNARSLQENGGLLNDSTFILEGLFGGGQFLPNSNRATYPIRLENAGRLGFDNHIHLEQQYAIPRDSSGKGHPLMSISHRFHHRSGEDRFIQKGALSMQWSQILYDSTLTKHQLQWEEFTNELAVRLYLRKQHESGSPLVAGIRHSAYSMIQLADSLQGDTLEVSAERWETSGHHLEVFGSLRYDLGSRFYAEAGAALVLSGYNSGNMDLRFCMHAGNDTSKHHITLFAGFRNRTPELLAKRLVSNHISWDQNLSDQQFVELRGAWHWKKTGFRLEGGVFLVNKYVYFRENAAPEQAGDAALVAEGNLSQYFKLGHFGALLKATGQYSSASYIPLPNLIARVDLHYEGLMFKSNLRLRIGLDMYYVSKYYGRGYDPLTAQFYVQDQIETGGYPYADFYVSARISHVRFWFKLRNVNQRFPSVPYFLSPHHPMQDRSFQVGITWNFYG